MTQGKEIAVGSVIVAAIVVSVVGTLWLQGTNFGRGASYVEVLTRNVGQLTDGNAVKFRGVSIGRVDGIEVEPGGNAVRLGLNLQGELALGDDIAVLIAPESLFGDWQAEIVTRSASREFPFFDVPRADLTRDTLVLGGYAIPDISRLTAAADEIAQNLRVLTDRFELAFSQETANQFSTAIGNIEGISADIRDLIGQQASTFDNVSVQVERAATEIGQASMQARLTLEELDALLRRGNVDSILVNVRNVFASLERIAAEVDRSTGGMEKALARADSAFSSVQRLTARLEVGGGALGRLIADSTLVIRAENAITQLDSLLADMQRNPRRYVRLSIF